MHDSKIDDYALSLNNGITILHKYADPQEEGFLDLTATQALQLLAWLEKHKDELERLAKEEET